MSLIKYRYELLGFVAILIYPLNLNFEAGNLFTKVERSPGSERVLKRKHVRLKFAGTVSCNYPEIVYGIRLQYNQFY
jgi:hypothetical protein